MDIIKRIREIREAKGYTQADMAKILNIAVLNYGKIERGVTDLTITRLEEIAKILNVRLVDFFTDFDPDTNNLLQNLQTELKTANKYWAFFVSKYNDHDDLAYYCLELFGEWLVSGTGFTFHDLGLMEEEDEALIIERLQDPNIRKIFFALLSFGNETFNSRFFAGFIWKLAPFNDVEKRLLRNFMRSHFDIENEQLIYSEPDDVVKAKIKIEMEEFRRVDSK